MAHYLDQGLEVDKPHLIPGVVELLGELCQMPQVLLGLLTGNARECAFIKLRHAQLHDHFQDGGFGDEHHDRNQLATRARDKANQALPPGATLAAGWVIGDTPRDIQAARQMGARCLAVASGAYSADELVQAGADHVTTELHPTPELIQLLVG
jgi:phosphoglycolate phosphatase